MYKKIFKLTCSVMFAFLFFSLQNSSNLRAQTPSSTTSCITLSKAGLFAGVAASATLAYFYFNWENNEFSEKEMDIIQKYATKIIKLKKQLQPGSLKEKFIKLKTLYSAANGSIKDTLCIAIKYLFS